MTTTTSVQETTSRDDAMKAHKFVSYRGCRRRARDFGDDVDARRCDAAWPVAFSAVLEVLFGRIHDLLSDN